MVFSLGETDRTRAGPTGETLEATAQSHAAHESLALEGLTMEMFQPASIILGQPEL